MAVAAVVGATIAATVAVAGRGRACGPASAAFAIIRAVESRAFEDNRRQAELPPGFLAARRTTMLRWSVEPLRHFVVMSTATAVFVDRQRCHPPESRKKPARNGLPCLLI
jgi:hypothetical protein